MLKHIKSDHDEKAVVHYDVILKFKYHWQLAKLVQKLINSEVTNFEISSGHGLSGPEYILTIQDQCWGQNLKWLGEIIKKMEP